MKSLSHNQQRVKFSKMRLIMLDALQDNTQNLADLFVAILRSGYSASQGKINYEMRGIQRRRNRKKKDATNDALLRQRYWQLMYFLKRDHLIVNNKNDRPSLTAKGMAYLQGLKDRQLSLMPKTQYTAKESRTYIIVSFDVPERERKKRTWLRATLQSLGLKMVQQSLWIGKVELPTAFIEDIRTYRLAEYVEIFGVSKAGTLRHLL